MSLAPLALARLREGNRRFVDGGAASGDRPSAAQQPFAIILGCSDSRVPAELIFGQGFGDLFVIRVAGNVAPSQVGCVEFAAEVFETRLARVRCCAMRHAAPMRVLGQCLGPSLMPNHVSALWNCYVAPPNKRLKVAARVDCGMNLSSARRSLSAVR